MIKLRVLQGLQNVTDIKLESLVTGDREFSDYYIVKNQPLGASQTFIYDDKLVLSGTDHLCIIAGSSADLDVTISYIDQDWS